VLLAVPLALAVLLAIGGVIGSQVAQLATKIPEYSNTIEQKIDSVRAATVDRVSGLCIGSVMPQWHHRRLMESPNGYPTLLMRRQARIQLAPLKR
jgi:hypothetical protein